MHRRDFLKLSGLASAGLPALVPEVAHAAEPEQSNFTLRIAPVTLDIGPGKTSRPSDITAAFPDPSCDSEKANRYRRRLQRHRRPRSGPLAWTAHSVSGGWIHGRRHAAGDPASGHRRYRFTPAPAGTRWYHTHIMAHADLARAGFSGQFGIAIIEPARQPGDYDQEVSIAAHHWEPALANMGPPDNGWEIMYRSATFNGKMLGAGDPVRVQNGQRVLFRILNASATDEIRLALPGHRFTVTAMDGNPLGTSPNRRHSCIWISASAWTPSSK